MVRTSVRPQRTEIAQRGWVDGKGSLPLGFKRKRVTGSASAKNNEGETDRRRWFPLVRIESER